MLATGVRGDEVCAVAGGDAEDGLIETRQHHAAAAPVRDAVDAVDLLTGDGGPQGDGEHVAGPHRPVDLDQGPEALPQ